MFDRVMAGKGSIRGFIPLCAVLVFLALTGIGAWGAEPLMEADLGEFIRNLRAENRADRIGYLVSIGLPPTSEGEEKVLGLAGCCAFAGGKGWLAHLDLARLENLQRSGIPFQIIDKKRLDDHSEAWYLVWLESAGEMPALKARFEPLFQDGHTVLIRIRAEDSADLESLKLPHSVVEEALLPGRRPVKGVKTVVKTTNPQVAILLPRIQCDRMIETVQVLQDCRSRHVRQPGNAQATKWLAEEFAKIPGLSVTTPALSGSPSGNNLANVVAELRGTTQPGTVYVVCGHFDSTVTTSNHTFAPGADDNGSGAAGVLEMARAMAYVQVPATVLFVCMNAEETGMNGSKAFARSLAQTPAVTLKAAINMDMISDRDDNEAAVIGNTNSRWLIDVFKDAAQAYTGLQTKPLYDSKIWQSDHSSFWNIGIPAILTTEGYPEFSPYLHTAKDLLPNMDPKLMERIARSNLATLLTLNPPEIR